MPPSENDPEALYKEAKREEDRRHLPKAEDLYRKFVALCPDDPRGPNKIGVMMILRGQKEGARQQFEAALQLDPRFAPALTNLGNIALEEGRLDEAFRLYEEALRVDPEYPQAHNNIAVVYKRRGQTSDMVRHLKQAQRNRMRNDRKEAREELSRRGCMPAAHVLVLFGVVSLLEIGVHWH